MEAAEYEDEDDASQKEAEAQEQPECDEDEASANEEQSDASSQRDMSHQEDAAAESTGENATHDDASPGEQEVEDTTEDDDTPASADEEEAPADEAAAEKEASYSEDESPGAKEEEGLEPPVPAQTRPSQRTQAVLLAARAARLKAATKGDEGSDNGTLHYSKDEDMMQEPADSQPESTQEDPATEASEDDRGNESGLAATVLEAAEQSVQQALSAAMQKAKAAAASLDPADFDTQLEAPLDPADFDTQLPEQALSSEDEVRDAKGKRVFKGTFKD